MNNTMKTSISAVGLIIAAVALIGGQTILGSVCVIIAAGVWLVPKSRT